MANKREDDVKLDLVEIIADAKRESENDMMSELCANETCYCDGSCRGERESSEGWRKKSKPSELNVKISADVGEAITGFKALQRELRDTTKAARELEGAYKDVEEVINVMDKDRGLIASIGKDDIIAKNDITVEIDGK